MLGSFFRSTPAKPLPGPVTVVERRQLQRAYEIAMEMSHQAPSKSLAAFRECLLRDPGNVIYVDTFLQLATSQQALSRSLVSSVVDWQLRRALRTEDWSRVLELATRQLARHGSHELALVSLARMCESAGFSAAERRYLQQAIEQHRDHPPLVRQLARALMRQGLFESAKTWWQELARIAPGDAEAEQSLKQLTAPTTESTGSRSIEGTNLSEMDLQQLEQAVEQNPGAIEPYLQLAEARRARGEYEQAEAVLGRARMTSPGDLRIQEHLEELACDRARYQLELAQQQAARSGSAEAGQLVEQLQQQLDRIELDVYDRRCQRQPAAAEWRLEVARRLARLGQLRQAVEQYERAGEDPSWHAVAELEKGECLQALRQFEPALRAYQAALAADAGLPSSLLARGCYQAARLAEALGQADLAQGYVARLETLAAEDEEAASRLDKLRQNRHKG